MQERDALLATKLRVPRSHDVLVRPRLLERLEEAASRELLLVSAPAGFGKSTLLAEWARGGGRLVAWVSLDADDNDPARLWRYLVAAVEQLHPGLEERALPLLHAPDQPALEALVTAVVNELAAAQRELSIVLDDYHVIESRPIHDSLALLLERLPPGVHVAIAGRGDPPLPLARMRARGQLAEVRAEDLRFTPDEAVSLMRESWGLDLPEASVLELGDRTEGWVTGLQLAALTLRRGVDPAGLIKGFSGGHRYVLDYLTGEVLERQPDDVRRFLLDTSILERLSGPLCDAVTGRCDGQRMLEDLERANLFLVALDEERRWYRYHRLFADLLRVRLRTENAERPPGLHRRAAAWFEEHGLIDDAVRHAMAAGDPHLAARLVEESFDEVLRRAEGATLRRWLAALPAQVVRSRPRLSVAQALAAFNAGRLEAVEPLLKDAERALAEPPEEARDGAGAPSADESALANLPAAIALLRAGLAWSRGDAERTVERALQARAHLGADAAEDGPPIAIRWQLGLAAWMRGNLPEAERVFAGLAAQGRATGPPHLALSAGAILGAVQRAGGRLGAALRTYREGLEFASQPGRPLVLTAGTAHVGMAEVLYQRDQLDDALRHVDQGIALCRQLTSTQSLAQGLATLAWIRQARGDPASALEAMEEARRAFPDPDTVSLYNPVPAERARLLLANGAVAEAAGRVEDLGLSQRDEPTYAREREYLVLARVLLAREAPARALELLGRLDALARAQGRTASLIEAGALQALALHAVGDRAGALTALVEALGLAWPEGYVRVFADEGPAMASLLGAVVGGGRRERAAGVEEIPMDYLGRLLRATQPAPAAAGPEAPRTPAALVEALTERELEVLRMLAAGKRNQEIADELVVTLHTVKKHVTHTFEKLGAANRTQAVAHARQLGLLQ